MTKKSQAAMEFLMTYGWAILAAIIVIGLLVYYFYHDSPISNPIVNPTVPPEFCMVAIPNYLLSCEGTNGTIIVTADINTIDSGIAKNNCTIIEEKDQIEITYCAQPAYNETLKKYKIQLEEY